MLPRLSTMPLSPSPPPPSLSPTPSSSSGREDGASAGSGDSTPTTAGHEHSSGAHVDLAGPLCQFRVGSAGTVWLDYGNRQVVVVQQKQVARYPYDPQRVTGSRRPSNIRFESSEYDSVSIARFCPQQVYIAAQISATTLEFTHLDSKKRFRKTSKRGSRTPILDFYWLYADNMVLITSESVEFYKVSHRHYELKLLKDYRLPVNWFVYSHGNRFLACATGPLSDTVQGFYFEQPDSIARMPKFQLDLGPAAASPLSAQQLVVCNIYRRLYCLFVNVRQRRLELYQYNRDKVLFAVALPIDPLHAAAHVSVQVVDNLLVVHSPHSRLSTIHDIQDRDPQRPLLPPRPLALPPPLASQLYADSWEYLQPRFVIDRATGLLWQLALNVDAIADSCPPSLRTIEFLLRRTNGKPAILRILDQLLARHDSLEHIAAIFDLITSPLAELHSSSTTLAQQQRQRELTADPLPDILRSLANQTAPLLPDSPAPIRRWPSSSSSSSSSSTSSLQRSSSFFVVIEQQDLYPVFSRFEETQSDDKYVVAVVTEYIRALYAKRVRPDFFLFELVITSLVRRGRYCQLHQFLQYHVVCDSVPVACQLLSMEQLYPPAYQLAMDMLKRLCSPEQIVEVLLIRHQFLPALRVLRSHSVPAEQIPRSRFLAAALNAADQTTFFTVYSFFWQRREIPATPEYQPYIDAFRDRYPGYTMHPE